MTNESDTNNPPPGDGAKPSDELNAYEIEPVAPTPASGSSGGASVNAPKEPREKRIGDEPVLAGFDEDADFDHDPEVAKALGRQETRDDDDSDEPATPTVPLVNGEGASAKTLAMIGGGIVACAFLAALLTADKNGLARGIGAAYLVVFHTLTGVGAIALAAHLLGRAIGPIDHAAARMFVAVGTFVLIVTIRLPFLGVFDRLVLVPAAAGAYFLCLLLVLRFPRHEAGVVAVMHAVMAILMWVLIALHTWAVSE